MSFSHPWESEYLHLLYGCKSLAHFLGVRVGDHFKAFRWVQHTPIEISTKMKVLISWKAPFLPQRN